MSARHSAPDILRLWPSIFVPSGMGSEAGTLAYRILWSPMLSEYSLLETCEMSLDAPIPPFSGSMDVDEFMAFMDTRPGKEHWELIEGVAVLMTPASFAQRRIAHNLSELLNREFETRSLDLFAYIGVAVRVQNSGHFQSQPDVVIIPGVASYDFYS